MKLACNMFADKTGGYPIGAWIDLESDLEDYVDVANMNDPQSPAHSYIYSGTASDCSFKYHSELEEDFQDSSMQRLNCQLIFSAII